MVALRRLFLLGLLTLVVVSLLSGCGGGGGQPKGDTLSESERNTLYGNVLLDGGTFGESFYLYTQNLIPDFVPPDPPSAPTDETGLSKGQIKELILKSLQGMKGTARNTSPSWSGPDSGGWYTITSTITFDTGEEWISINLAYRFRYFRSTHRLELTRNMTISSTGTPASITFSDNGYLVFNADVLADPMAYPVSGSWDVEATGPSMHDPAKTATIGFRFDLANMTLVTLTGYFPVRQFLTGRLDIHVTAIDPADSYDDVSDYHIFDATTEILDKDAYPATCRAYGTWDYPWDDLPSNGSYELFFEIP